MGKIYDKYKNLTAPAFYGALLVVCMSLSKVLSSPYSDMALAGAVFSVIFLVGIAIDGAIKVIRTPIYGECDS